MQTPYIPLIVTLVVYIAIIYLIGYLASKLTKNLSDYVLGGRRLSALIVSLAAGASDMSGWLLLALPGAVFTSGIQAFWLPIGLSIGAYLNWTFVAKRLRVFTEAANNSLTIPTFLKNRFKSHHSTLGIVTTVVILIFYTVYCAAGFISGALLLSTFFKITYHHALLLTTVAIVIYLIMGGFLALSWIDFFQGSLMFCALIIVPLLTLHHIGARQNLGEAFHHLAASHLHLVKGVGWIYIVSMLGWGLGYCGQPHILVRFMAIAKPGRMFVARNICMVWMIVSLLGACAVGLLGSMQYAHLAKPETIILHLATDLLNPWIVGFLMAAILSAIMSTTSAQLLVNSSALTEDIYHRIKKSASQKELLLVSRIMVVLVSIIAYVIAFNPQTNLLYIVSFAWSGLGASFGPLIILSLYWRRCTQTGAITGLIVGAVTVIVWHTLGREVGGIFKLYELVPAFALSFVSVVVVSLLGKQADESIFTEFEALQRQD
jgi:sodium/proline symporter